MHMWLNGAERFVVGYYCGTCCGYKSHSPRCSASSISRHDNASTSGLTKIMGSETSI